MKTLFLLVILLPALELGAQTQAANWSTLATHPKPKGSDFEKQFRKRHFYLVGQGVCTRVPRQSILHLPKDHQDKVLEKPQGRQVSWIEFLGANRNWLSHKEVTWAQVLGEVPLSEKVLESFGPKKQLVVASYRGGPVTVLKKTSEKSED